MFEELNNLLEQSGKDLDFFFRDDDADRDVPSLRRLLDLFTSRGVPLSLAVIPGTLTDDGARLLRNAASGARIEIHQHGWMHVNHEQQGRKCEFGPARSLRQQRDDIARGWQRLGERFDALCAPVFTPPWNRCTEETREALCELGFRLLSRDISAPPAAGTWLPEIPVSVDLFRWKTGPRLKEADELRAEIGRSVDRGGPVGILLHHKVMSETAFDRVASLVDVLRANPRLRFHTLEAACAIRS